MARVASASEAAAGHLLLNEVGHHLGVGGRDERVPGGHELGPQLGVVLDDAVVDQGQPPGAVRVRVGVLGGGAAVGGPAGVTDRRRMPRRGVGRQVLELGHGIRCRRPPGPARWRPRFRRCSASAAPAPSAPASTTMATPAESYPRYSSWCRAPSRRGMASDSPVTPMMPHIRTQATWAYLGACGSICPSAALTTPAS